MQRQRHTTNGNGHATNGNGKEKAAVPDLEPATKQSNGGKEGQSVRSRLRSIFRGSESATLEQSENGKAAIPKLEPAPNGNLKDEAFIHPEFVSPGQSENGQNGNENGKDGSSPLPGNDPATNEQTETGKKKERQPIFLRLWSFFL